MAGLESVRNKNSSASFCPLHALGNYPSYIWQLLVFLSKVHTRMYARSHTHTHRREKTFQKEYNKVNYFVMKKQIRHENHNWVSVPHL